jgi:PAS domain S-box-containing protein
VARFRAFFDRAAIGFSLLSLDGQFIETNPALQRMLGYSESEFRRLFVADIVVPEERPLITAQLSEVVRGRREAFQSERRYRSKDGTTVCGNVTASLVRDARGEPRAIIGMVEDITERKRIEEQFHRSQRLEAVGRLAGGLAHDFNNLLTVILGFADALGAEIGAAHPGASYLDEIAQAAERGASLTRQLLAFSRQQVLSPVALDLNTIVTRMQNMLGYLIGKDIAIEAELEPQLRLVKADPGQIEQVILNLAMNARDAMPSGGRLTFTTANVQLGESDARRYRDTAPGPYAVLTVRDTGHGMDEEVRSHIFEPFFTTKEPGKGMGLGLPTVYGMVNQSNGQIVVESAPGQGSAFHIYLPAVDPSVPVACPEALLPTRRAAGAVVGSETILLVENDPMVRTLVQKIATAAGYRVLVAAASEEAIQIAEQHPGAIHLLVTDLVTSGLSGTKVAQRFAERRPETRVLYLSGSSDDAVIRQGVVAAGTAFVQKPFKSSTLLQKIREVLDLEGE